MSCTKKWENRGLFPGYFQLTLVKMDMTIYGHQMMSTNHQHVKINDVIDYRGWNNISWSFWQMGCENVFTNKNKEMSIFLKNNKRGVKRVWVKKDNC